MSPPPSVTNIFVLSPMTPTQIDTPMITHKELPSRIGRSLILQFVILAGQPIACLRSAKTLTGGTYSNSKAKSIGSESSQMVRTVRDPNYSLVTQETLKRPRRNQVRQPHRAVISRLSSVVGPVFCVSLWSIGLNFGGHRRGWWSNCTRHHHRNHRILRRSA